jgi:hypothetical protein
MRFLFVVLLIVLQAPSAIAAESVTVLEPITSVVANRDRLRELCVVDGRYDACTRFIAFRIDGSCVPDGQKWRIDASASFRPFILLWNLRSLSHEQEHVGDLRRSVGGLMAGLGSIAFESRDGCAARLTAEQGAFGDTLRTFATASNLERHPSLRPRR